MHIYRLLDSPWAVVAAEVTLATPYAILVLLQYSKLIPIELDEPRGSMALRPSRSICASTCR